MGAIVEYYGAEGEVFDKYDDISNLWAYVSHFHHVPFYVYSYAFADLVVGSLYHAYTVLPDGFEAKLLDLLRAGGTKDFVTALTLLAWSLKIQLSGRKRWRPTWVAWSMRPKVSQ